MSLPSKPLPGCAACDRTVVRRDARGGRAGRRCSLACRSPRRLAHSIRSRLPSSRSDPRLQLVVGGDHGISHVDNDVIDFESNSPPITTAMSFNRSLWHATAAQIGREARAFMNAARVAYWAPVINPSKRAALVRAAPPRHRRTHTTHRLRPRAATSSARRRPLPDWREHRGVRRRLRAQPR